MEKIEIKRTGGFTTIQNAIIRDKRLSLSALGLLTVFLSLPPDWDYSITGISAIRTEKATAIKSAMRELKDAGYLTVEKLFPGETGSGRIEYKYTVYDVPQEVEKQGAEKQGVEILPLEILPLENLPLEELNTNKSNTYILNTNIINNTPPISPPPERVGRDTLTATQENLFALFWAEYPKKVAKESARKAWKKINPDERLTETIVEAIKSQIKTDGRFREERFIPHPATWLNGIEWENSYKEIKPEMRHTTSSGWDYIEQELAAEKARREE